VQLVGDADAGQPQAQTGSRNWIAIVVVVVAVGVIAGASMMGRSKPTGGS